MTVTESVSANIPAQAIQSIYNNNNSYEQIIYRLNPNFAKGT